MSDSVTPSSLQMSPHLSVFEEMLNYELNRIKKSDSLAYMFDTVDARFLDILAEQFDMLGYNGWFLAETEQQKRDLLKSASSIKSYLGTPYAIKQAARALGIKGEILINEGIGFQYNGTFKYNGTMRYGAGQWALFTVGFDGDLNPGVSGRLEDFKRMIEVIKPARQKLLFVYLY